MHYKNNKSGFTLIEILLSMSIFLVFMTIVVNSYASLSGSQRIVNDQRKLYSVSREIFDVFTSEARDSYIYYGDNGLTNFNNGVEKLTFVSNDGVVLNTFYRDEKGDLYFNVNNNCGLDVSEQKLNDDFVGVKELSFYVTPAYDPYLEENVIFNSLQFQPKVTIFMTLEDVERNITMDFQTTISMRIYQSAPEVNPICLMIN